MYAIHIDKVPYYRGFILSRQVRILPGPSGLSVLSRCLYYGGVHKARFNCSCAVPENIPELLFFDAIEAGIDLWR